MYGGRIRFTTPMLWSMGFLVTFVIGGMTGVLLAVPPADFCCTTACFWSPISTTSSSAACCCAGFAGVTYWFPKAFGFKLGRRLGQGRVLALSLIYIRFYVVFMPLYMAGLLGMTRRLQHYDGGGSGAPMGIYAAGIGIVIMILRRSLSGGPVRRQHPAARRITR